MASVLILTGCTAGPDRTASAGPCDIVANGTPSLKAGAGFYRSDMTAVRTRTYAVATANPLATQAACRVLRGGGTAADAAVTAQAVLGLVEPQSSGLGGGGLLLHYDAASGRVQAYDGRETAPAAATESKPGPQSSGRSIGVPGVVRMLAEVHAEHGETPWRDLLTPAMTLADNGFEVSPRLAIAIAEHIKGLARDPAAAGYFLNPDGTSKPSGSVLTNPDYAATLSRLAADPDAFYSGEIAAGIIDAVSDTSGRRTAGLMTAQDLADYRSVIPEPVCSGYRGKQICGMPPPSSGGIAIAQILGVLSSFDLRPLRPTDIDRNGGRPTVRGVHLVAEAERLAYADRDRYVADPDFVPLPGGTPESLLARDYLAARAALISPERTMGTAEPGSPVPEHGTSHISVVDSRGNAVSYSATVQSAFGSFRMVGGFLLNDELTAFAADAVGTDGTPVANRIQPGKRPRSSMAPTLIFDESPGGGRGPLYAVVGSPGGSMIIQYVAKTLVGILDWGLDAQQAVSMVNFGASNSPTTNVGGEHPAIDINDDGADDPLITGLRELGHEVDLAEQSSGLSALVRGEGGWVGGADPRREGDVMGDTE